MDAGSLRMVTAAAVAAAGAGTGHAPMLACPPSLHSEHTQRVLQLSCCVRVIPHHPPAPQLIVREIDSRQLGKCRPVAQAACSAADSWLGQ